MVDPVGPTPLVVPWADAPAMLLELARRAGRPRTAIGITGPVGAGKSSLARALGGTVLSTDDYLPDYDIVPYLERDDPSRADLPLLAANLADLRSGRAASVPVWSFFSHRRESHRSVLPADLIVVEGIHALHHTVRRHLDLAVFVEAPPETRWSRLESREAAGERGWPLDHLRDHFHEVAEPTFFRHADAYRRAADVLVVNT